MGISNTFFSLFVEMSCPQWVCFFSLLNPCQSRNWPQTFCPLLGRENFSFQCHTTAIQSRNMHLLFFCWLCVFTSYDNPKFMTRRIFDVLFFCLGRQSGYNWISNQLCAIVDEKRRLLSWEWAYLAHRYFVVNDWRVCKFAHDNVHARIYRVYAGQRTWHGTHKLSSHRRRPRLLMLVIYANSLISSFKRLTHGILILIYCERVWQLPELLE